MQNYLYFLSYSRDHFGTARHRWAVLNQILVWHKVGNNLLPTLVWHVPSQPIDHFTNICKFYARKRSVRNKQVVWQNHFRSKRGKLDLINMYKLNDLKKLKKDQLIAITESKNIEINKKITKSSIIELLTTNGYVLSDTNIDQSNINLSLNVSFDFLSEDIFYERLDESAINILPTVNFEHIYRYCCHDLNNYKSLDRACKHKTASDIVDLKLCKVHIINTTSYTHSSDLHTLHTYTDTHT